LAGDQPLGTVRLFAGLSERELDTIRRVAGDRTVPAGTVVCQQGEPGHQFFVILDGDAGVERAGRQVARPSGRRLLR
jgi:CRP-like cAMP-binding protein